MSNAWDQNRPNVPMDWGVFAFSAAVTLLTGLRFWPGAGMAGRARRGQQQPERERADHDAAAQRAGRQSDCRFSDCAFNAAGGGRGTVSAYTLRAQLNRCRTSGPTSDSVRDRSARPAIRQRARMCSCTSGSSRHLRHCPALKAVTPSWTAYIADNMSNDDFIPEGEAATETMAAPKT